MPTRLFSTVRLVRLVAGLALGWYVVTYSGQHVAGPFASWSDCNEMAAIMHARYPLNVSTFCQSAF